MRSLAEEQLPDRQYRRVRLRRAAVAEQDHARHSANPLRALADIALVVSAHDERPHIQPLLYRSALQHLLDGLFVRLCEDDARRAQLLANLERAERMQDP